MGRLLDFIKRGRIDVANLRFLIIDEADRQLMDGFEESLQQFLQLEELPTSSKRVTIMTSATMSPEGNTFLSFLGNPLRDKSRMTQVQSRARNFHAHNFP